MYQDSLDSAEKATKLIDSAWAQLPAEARNALRAQRQRAKGMLCAERFFANCKAGNWELVRKFGLETVRHQPNWLRNLGFVSIWTRATLRPVYPALAEDWHRQKFATNH